MLPFTEKVCIRCNVLKPLGEFHKSSYSSDGYKDVCKECRARAEGFNYKPPINSGFRRCHKCRKELPMTEDFFYRDRKGKNGLGYQCKECANEKADQWSANNPKRSGEIKKEWYYSNIEKARSISKTSGQKRRDKKRRLPNAFTEYDWEFSINYFNGCCAVCERPLRDLFSTHTAAMDHWIPFSSPDCPGTIPSNIVPLCQGQDGCNNSKSNRNAQEWLLKKFGKRKATQILSRVEKFFEVVAHRDGI
jgi:hypothetical protein